MAISPDRRFRLVNDYAGAAGYFAGFPNFHEADYGNGVVGGVHLLRDTVAEWRDVPRDTYGVYHIEDVPGLFRGAADYASAHGYAAAFPNCHQADHGQGVVYGTILLKPGTVEWRDVPRATLGNPAIGDVRAMMTAAANYAWANGYVAAFPTFHQADHGAGVVYGVHLFPPGTADWRDVSMDDLLFQEPKVEQTCVVLCQFRNADGSRGPVPAARSFYESFFFEEGAGGLADYYREVTHGRVRLQGQVVGWLDIGHTVAEHGSRQFQAQRIQAYDWGVQAAQAAGVNVNTFTRRVVIIDQDTDWGGVSLGSSMLLPHSAATAWSHARAAHEFGHVLGLDDALSTEMTPTGVVDTRYRDDHCIMSYATRGSRYQSTVAGDTSETGPGLNGVYARALDGIPPSRIYSVPAVRAAETVQLAALTHAEEDGALLVEVPPTPARPRTYLVELHHKSGWDRAIPTSRVAVHESRPGDGGAYVLVVNGSRSLSSDDQTITTPDGSIGIRLVHIDGATAAIRVWELGPNRTREVRIANVVWDPPGDDVVGERVVIRNDRLQRVDLAGWVLRDSAQHPASPPTSFVFPHHSLAPGEDVTVWTKPGQNAGANLYWNRSTAVWNNRGGDAAILVDNGGTEISRFAW
jgi:hypothetical protein